MVFSVLSFITYIILGNLPARHGGLGGALVAPCMVGVYDAIVSWKIAIALKANFGKYDEEYKKDVAGL